MPVYLTLLAMCVAGVEMIVLLKLMGHVGVTARISREVLAVVRDPDLGDDRKEAATRGASIALFRETGLFALKFLAVAAVLVGLYFAAIRLAGVPEAELNARLLAPLSWLYMTVFAIVYLRVRHAVQQRL